MAKQITVGIIGLGNIGSSVAKLLRTNQAVIEQNASVKIKVKKVCDIKKRKTSFAFTSNPNEIINDPDIDVVVETIGGVKPALKLILAALNNKKHVVTPNKEVIAKHMSEIMAAARKNRVQVFFEGAVGGGIPVIQALEASLDANRLNEVYGIVNGTTNYILTKMQKENMELAEALKMATENGFAEPDPTADIEGYDAAYKATILAAVAFGAKVNWQEVACEGITKITQEDIQYANDIGYVIKLLAITKLVAGQVEVRVHPALVPKSHPLASVSDNFNAIYIKGQPIGELMFYGPGAGGGPTASAIISDIIQVAKKSKARGQKLKTMRLRKTGDIASRYYLRLQAPDRSGVLAGISKAFAQKKVSIAAVVQKETIGNQATIVILVHKVQDKNLQAALKAIKKLAVVKKICNVIRII